MQKYSALHTETCTLRILDRKYATCFPYEHRSLAFPLHIIALQANLNVHRWVNRSLFGQNNWPKSRPRLRMTYLKCPEFVRQPPTWIQGVQSWSFMTQDRQSLSRYMTVRDRTCPSMANKGPPCIRYLLYGISLNPRASLSTILLCAFFTVI
jgi:hypothetical protein